MAEGMQQATEEHGPEEQASTEGACRLTIADAGPRLKALNDAWDEIERLRLTDEEREAIEAAVRIIDAYEEEMDGFPSGAASTLRGLLERIGDGACGE